MLQMGVAVILVLSLAISSSAQQLVEDNVTLHSAACERWGGTYTQHPVIHSPLLGCVKRPVDPDPKQALENVALAHCKFFNFCVEILSDAT
jgi:hypothetical protein